MLTHHFETPQKPSRVVVLGSGGFIGGAIHRRLNAAGLATLALSRAQVDLEQADAAVKLADLLEIADTLVFASAKAKTCVC